MKRREKKGMIGLRCLFHRAESKDGSEKKEGRKKDSNQLPLITLHGGKAEGGRRENLDTGEFVAFHYTLSARRKRKKKEKPSHHFPGSSS